MSGGDSAKKRKKAKTRTSKKKKTTETIEDVPIQTTVTEATDKEAGITQLKRLKLVNGKDNKSIKFREPNDIQQREQKVSKHDKKKEYHPLGPLNVLPRRENQNDYVLGSPCMKRKGEFPLIDEIEARTASDIQKHGDNSVDVFPMEALLSKGFMPFYSHDITKVMCTASNEFYRESMTIVNKKKAIEMENAVATSPQQQQQSSVKKRKTKHAGDDDDATVASNVATASHHGAISSTFAWDIPNYGYNNTTGKAELYDKVNKFHKNCELRMKAFFINDQLEYNHNGGDVPLKHRPPRTSGIYRELEAKLMGAFKEMNTVLRESASRVPKFDDEPPLTKQWIDSYRLRPVSSDELCSRGGHCKFNTFGKKDNMRYVGRVFETPREARDAENGTNAYVRNKDRLCYDCLLYDLTMRTYDNVSNDTLPMVQINYFTVLCEPGQYRQDKVMLPITLNGKPTGIVGNVPAYNTANRISLPIKIRQIEGNNFYHISTNYLAETGMDF